MWYAPIEPYNHDFLDTGDGHFVYWETSGHPAGVPILVVHGGPGGGATPNSRRWFDPRRYRIIVFDQRGCGRSTPHACITANTTPDLLADMEALRHRLGVGRWVLWGRSWGSTLALAYAEAHPDCVVRLVLSGVFTAQRSELDWLYRGGSARLFPAAWDRFRMAPAAAGSADGIAAYHGALTCGDAGVERTAARAWCEWEHTLSSAGTIPLEDDDAMVVAGRGSRRITSSTMRFSSRGSSSSMPGA